MKTFEGWGVFWDNIVVVAQNNSKVSVSSRYKNIYGYLMPLINNKYLNILYFTIKGLILIKKLNKEYKFDLFQASDPGGAILAFVASRLFNKKFLFEVQGEIFDFPNETYGNELLGKLRANIVRYISKTIVKKADYIRIISPFLYEPLDRFGIDRKKVFIVPPRCDSKLFNKKRIEGQYHENIDRNKKNLLFIGNLTKAKGINILLDAFSLVVKRNDKINLIIIGSGEEENNLKEQVKQLKISNNVKFFGRIANTEIPIVMNSVDIFILPSIEEGMGRVLLESMAMQLPIIASNVGGIPLLIENNIDGLLFTVGDREQLAEYILSLLFNEALKERLTNNANKKFLENYEYQVSMKMFVDMYKNIFKMNHENT
jgi:glycosyltransferase involved in cell wall biosynthesis